MARLQDYLIEHSEGRGLDRAELWDLEAFVASIESAAKASAKTHLWAIRYCYDFSQRDEMRTLARVLRQQRITHRPVSLAKFRGVSHDHVQALAAEDVTNADQMLKAGRTGRDRESLAAQTDVPGDAIHELVKLSDLARIPGLRSVRARLYHDAGADTVKKVAQWDPEALWLMLEGFCARTGFDGIAPLPREVAFTVTTAQRLAHVVDYSDEA